MTNGHTLRVGSRFGPTFDTAVPDDFSLEKFVHDVRAKGYYFNGAVYVPHDTISFITLLPPGVIDPLTHSMTVMGEGGQTRQ